MKHLVRSAAMAFSCYSRIPVPVFEYDGREKRHVFCFFPLIGAVICAIEMLWLYAAERLLLNPVLCAVVFTVIPVFVTGGIHIDGYMDTSDAMASHKSAKEQLEIMKDPHIGSFAVISAVIWFMLFFGASYSVVMKAPFAAALVFCESRAFTSLAVVWMPRAKKDGMLSWYVRENEKKDIAAVSAVSVIYLAGSIFLQYYYEGITGTVIAAAGLLCFCFCCAFFKKRYGGITGDLAGFHLCCSEVVMLFAAAMVLR